VSKLSLEVHVQVVKLSGSSYETKKILNICSVLLKGVEWNNQLDRYLLKTCYKEFNMSIEVSHNII
jgi:hypothetical protein